MPRVIEFRIIMPFTVAQHGDATLFMVGKRTREEAVAGAGGIETISHEVIREEDGSETGHSVKIYHYGKRVPAFIRWMVPDSLSSFREESYSNWTRIPNVKTVYSVPALSVDRFYLDLVSTYLPYTDADALGDNPAQLPPEELEVREIVYLDVLKSAPVPTRADWQLEGFECPEAGIAKLLGGAGKCDEKRVPSWVAAYPGPKMVAIKVGHIKARLFGAGGPVESFVAKTQHDELLANSRGEVGWSREWATLTREQLAEYVDGSYRDVNAAMADDPTWRAKAKPGDGPVDGE
jgi:hypothetical protein